MPPWRSPVLAHLTFNQRVVGSNPTGGSIRLLIIHFITCFNKHTAINLLIDLSSAAILLRGLESRHAHQFIGHVSKWLKEVTNTQMLIV